MIISDICKLKLFKQSDTAVILGCGDSINRISNNEWNIISECDSYVMNEFLYHSFIPRFYHVEFKKDMNHWMKIRELKGSEYDNVIFICESARAKNYEKAISERNTIITYNLFQNWNRERLDILPPPDFKLHKYKLTKAFSASLTIVLEIVFKMNYKYIIFFGVDLYNSKYFWTDDRNTYPDVYERTNKNYPVDHPHNTVGVEKYIDWFNRTFMKPLKMNVYVGHKDTLLYTGNYLPYIDLTLLKRGKS